MGFSGRRLLQYFLRARGTWQALVQCLPRPRRTGKLDFLEDDYWNYSTSPWYLAVACSVRCCPLEKYKVAAFSGRFFWICFRILLLLGSTADTHSCQFKVAFWKNSQSVYVKVDSDPARPVRQRMHVQRQSWCFFFLTNCPTFFYCSSEKCAQSMLRLLCRDGETVARGNLEITPTSPL